MNIESKIEYFSTKLNDDRLFRYIAVHENLLRKLLEEKEFWTNIRIDEEYNNKDVASLVGASSGQRVLNILNDKERDFYSYIKPKKLGSLNIYDTLAAFRLKMIFFMLKESIKVNEVAFILNIIEPVSVSKPKTLSIAAETNEQNALENKTSSIGEITKKLLQLMEPYTFENEMKEILEKNNVLQIEIKDLKARLEFEREYNQKLQMANEEYIAQFQQINEEKKRLSKHIKK